MDKKTVEPDHSHICRQSVQYLTTGCNYSISINTGDQQHHRCRIWAAVSNAPSLIFFATWAAFCALRAYSMSNCKVIYATVVLCFGLVPFGVNLYPVVMQIEASSSNSELGCTLDWTPSAVSRDLVTAASRGSVIICDVMVLYVTLKNTWTSYFNSNVPSPVQSSLRSLLVRN
ncbi:hypothetical protein CERSUDRAFT_120052, partial [Gelatoporia subvermispora B]